MRTLLELAKAFRTLAGVAFVSSIISVIFIGFSNSFWGGVISLVFSWTSFVAGFAQGLLWDEWLAFQVGLVAVGLWIFGQVWAVMALSRAMSDKPVNTASLTVGSQWYGYDGRINRRGYALRQITAVIVSLFAYLLAFRIEGLLGTIIFWPIFVFGFSMYLCAAARRYHDMSLSAWFTLLLWIPGFGQLVWAILFLLPGRKSPNGYGLQPSDLDVTGRAFDLSESSV